jgi:hypothetical protein
MNDRPFVKFVIQSLSLAHNKYLCEEEEEEEEGRQAKKPLRENS